MHTVIFYQGGIFVIFSVDSLLDIDSAEVSPIFDLIPLWISTAVVSPIFYVGS